MHNPTTATMGETRRKDIARILRQAKIPLIEDDAYGALDPAQTLLATLIPRQTFLTVSLSKCMTPALRVSFLVAPDAQSIAILRDAVQAISQMASPLMTALVCQWLRSGEAKTIITAIRNEAAGRQQLAARILRGHPFASHPKGHHVWMPLPEGWSGTEFVGELFRRGLSVVASDAFAVDATSPSAIRLGLGAARSREDLASALYLLGATLRQWSGTRLVV
jgi:DNA-binding transcriptional MocR family regulator